MNNVQLEFKAFTDTENLYDDIGSDEHRSFWKARSNGEYQWVYEEHIRRDPDGTLSRAYELLLPRGQYTNDQLHEACPQLHEHQEQDFHHPALA